VANHSERPVLGTMRCRSACRLWTSAIMLGRPCSNPQNFQFCARCSRAPMSLQSYNSAPELSVRAEPAWATGEPSPRHISQPAPLIPPIS
jgi:hypothetical protein